MRDVTLPLLALASVAALSGCATSNATFSDDLDAYKPPGGVVTKPTGPIVITQAPTQTRIVSGTLGATTRVVTNRTPQSAVPVATHQATPKAVAPTTPKAAVAQATPKTITQGPVYGASLEQPDTSSSFDNLEFVTPTLKSKLAVVRVGADRSDSNLLTVFAGVRNKSAKPLNIEVQTIYKDKNGEPLTDGKGGWIPLNLKPHEETQYRSMAISEDATDYIVRIRHADDNPPPGP
jgi:hypothetical protein